jgi:hypothetical protein
MKYSTLANVYEELSGTTKRLGLIGMMQMLILEKHFI